MQPRPGWPCCFILSRRSWRLSGFFDKQFHLLCHILVELIRIKERDSGGLLEPVLVEVVVVVDEDLLEPVLLILLGLGAVNVSDLRAVQLADDDAELLMI